MMRGIGAGGGGGSALLFSGASSTDAAVLGVGGIRGDE